MDRNSLQQTIETRIAGLRMIAGALAASAILYAVAVWLAQVMLGLDAPIVELSTAVKWTIAISGLFVILVGYLVERSIRGGATGSASGEATPSGAEQGAALMDRYARSITIGFAFREVAAVLGFVLSLMTAELAWAFGLSAAALISMLVHWPRRAAVEDWLLTQRAG